MSSRISESQFLSLSVNGHNFAVAELCRQLLAVPSKVQTKPGHINEFVVIKTEFLLHSFNDGTTPSLLYQRKKIFEQLNLCLLPHVVVPHLEKILCSSTWCFGEFHCDQGSLCRQTTTDQFLVVEILFL